MKHLRILFAIVALAAFIGACTSKPKVDPEAMNQAMAVLSTTFNPDKVWTTDSGVFVSFDVDTLFNPEAAGAPVVRYIVAERLRGLKSAQMKEVTDVLRTAQTSLHVVLANDRKEVPFEFTAAELNTLRKASRIDMDLPAVRIGMINIADSMNSERFAETEGVQSVNVGLENGFITYTLKWSGKKTFDKSNQGLLTSRYQVLFAAQVKALEKVFPGITESMANAGIDGFRVQYAAGPESKVELKEAFPWRVLL